MSKNAASSAWRAKSKRCKDARSSNSIATGATEDAAARSFAAGRREEGLLGQAPGLSRDEPRPTLGAARPRIAILVFPGSNDDRDAAWALTALGAEPVSVWHDEPELPRGTAAVVVPGGFSYGDYLRCGALARFAPAMAAVQAFAGEGGLVLGICNGFQILCEAGLLPGALLPNQSLAFVCRDVAVRVERADTPFTARVAPGQQLRIPVKHGGGRWYAPPELIARVEGQGQVLLRYESADNPNGSLADVAGVGNEAGNVLGLMPHPEHAVDPLLGSGDGALLLASLVDAARDRWLPSRLTTVAAPPPAPDARPARPADGRDRAAAA